MKEKKSFWLQTVKQMNIGVGICGVGFLLYAVALSVGMETVADIVTFIFGAISIYVFLSVVDGRSKDKEAVSLNLLWGSGALMILLAGCAVLTLKLYLGL